MTHLVWPAQPGAILKITEIDDTTGQVKGHWADALAWCGVSADDVCATPNHPCDWHRHRYLLHQQELWAQAMLEAGRTTREQEKTA